MGQPDWTQPGSAAQLTQLLAQTSPINSDLFSGSITVGTTPTQIIALGAIVGAILFNPSTSVTVYIGGSAVAVGNTPLLPGAFQSWVIGVNTILYGIVAAGTQAVQFTYGYVQS